MRTYEWDFAATIVDSILEKYTELFYLLEIAIEENVKDKASIPIVQASIEAGSAIEVASSLENKFQPLTEEEFEKLDHTAELQFRGTVKLDNGYSFWLYADDTIRNKINIKSGNEIVAVIDTPNYSFQSRTDV